ncbi:MAG TPA: hypothetical protein VIK72_19285 [Clostridiaceae bacterium]
MKIKTEDSPKKEIVNIRMTKEMREQGEKQAAKLGLDLSNYVRMIIILDAQTHIIAKLKGKG